MILGVDPGSNACGWAVLDGGTPRDFGVIKLSGSWGLRMADLLTQFGALCCRHDCKKLVVETPFVGRFPKAVVGIAQARGVVLAQAYSFDIKDQVELAPTQWKRALGVGAHCSKDEVRRSVMDRFPEVDESTPEDAVDAIAIAYAHVLLSGPVEMPALSVPTLKFPPLD